MRFNKLLPEGFEIDVDYHEACVERPQGMIYDPGDDGLGGY